MEDDDSEEDDYYREKRHIDSEDDEESPEKNDYTDYVGVSFRESGARNADWGDDAERLKRQVNANEDGNKEAVANLKVNTNDVSLRSDLGSYDV